MKHSDLLSRVHVIRTREEARWLSDQLLSATGLVTSVDTEWLNYDDSRTNVHNGTVFCATFAWFDQDSNVQIAYLHNYRKQEGLIYELAEYWESDTPKTAHNCPVDWHALANHGIFVKRLDVDTMVMDHMVDENRENAHGLKECAHDHLGHYRKSFNETFGSPKLKANGEPYANKQLIVPSLAEYVCETDPMTPSEIESVLKHPGSSAGDKEIAKRWKTLIEYACADAYDGLLLFEFYREKLEAVPWLNGKSLFDFFWENECDVTNMIARMERRGMYLDIEWLRWMQEESAKDLERIETEIVEWAGAPFKVTSKPQLAKILYGSGPQEVVWEEAVENPTPRRKKRKVKGTVQGRNYPILRYTEKGHQPSCKAEHLVELERHVEKLIADQGEAALRRRGVDPDLSGLRKINDYNKRDKQRGTYLIGLVEKSYRNRIHTRINQIGTTSGRWSSSGPNLQNITTGDKDLYSIRDAFCAPPGKILVVADFSQLEYRLLAHFTQEPKLIDMFNNGWDLHSLTCYNIYPHVKRAVDEKFGGLNTEGLKWVAEEFPDERKRAKTLNFEIIYGVGYKKLADQLRVPNEEAKRMINGWFSGYPFVKAWMNRMLHEGRSKGYARTLAGRYRRPVLERLLSEDYGERGEEERSFLNALVQGSAADMTKKAMLLIDKNEELRKGGYEMVMQVHDEIVGQCPIGFHKRAVEILKPIMEQPFSRPLRVPMPVAIGVGPTWSTAKV